MQQQQQDLGDFMNGDMGQEVRKTAFPSVTSNVCRLQSCCAYIL